MTILGGLPATSAAMAKAAGRQRTSRAELLALLKRKSWQVNDLAAHPVCLGVPLGQDGGESQGVSVDIGLKNMATVSVADLADASPSFRQGLYECATAAGSGRVSPVQLLRQAEPVPMVVAVKEDMMHLPIANATSAASLARAIPSSKLDTLNDAFFRAAPPSAELSDLVLGGVPGADKHVAAREEYRREVRAGHAAARLAAQGKS